MELHSTGDLRVSCRPGLSHPNHEERSWGIYIPTPLSNWPRGALRSREGHHFSSTPCLPGWRQRAAAPGKCFWKSDGQTLHGRAQRDLGRAPTSEETGVETQTRAEQQGWEGEGRVKPLGSIMDRAWGPEDCGAVGGSREQGNTWISGLGHRRDTGAWHLNRKSQDGDFAA